MGDPNPGGLASRFLRAVGLKPKVKMDSTDSFQLPFEDQGNSDFFERLPGEVRDRIYTFALSSYADPDQLVCFCHFT